MTRPGQIVRRVASLSSTTLDILRTSGLRATFQRLGLWLRGVRRYHHGTTKIYDEDGRLDAVLACRSPNLTGLIPLSNIVAFTGYVLARSGVEHLDVYLDGQLLGQADIGLTDVPAARQYISFESGRHAGFIFRWDTTTVADGAYPIRLAAVLENGNLLEIKGHVQVDNGSRLETPYDKHISIIEAREIRNARSGIDQLEQAPLFSLIVPIGDSSELDVIATLDSIREQLYGAWELCICYSDAHALDWQARLEQLEESDPRIWLETVENAGTVVSVVNAVLEKVHSEFVIILQPRTRLAVHALYEFAVLLRDVPDADMVYVDDDIIDADGYRHSPFFKPDWSPDLLLSCNYIGPMCLLRRDLIIKMGGLLSGFGAYSDYAMYLRFTEYTQEIYHIAKVLAHREAYEVTDRQQERNLIRAVNDHLDRQNSEARAVPLIGGVGCRVVYKVTEYPKVSIIIPTAGQADLISTCIQSIHEFTEYPEFDLVIVDNSKRNHVRNYFDSLDDLNVVCQYIDLREQPFNYSTMNNEAVRVTDAPLLLFLNDDVTALHAGWLHEMVSHALRPEVGAVGAKLMYPDGRIQQAGALAGLPNGPANAFGGVFEDDEAIGRVGIRHRVVGNWSAVTGACLLTRREVFEQVSGFDETHFAVGFQDIDLCLKMLEKGYRIVYTPFARLIHTESTSRIASGNVSYFDIDKTECAWFLKKWSHIVGQDPFYNPNLSQHHDDFRLRVMDS